MRRGSTTPSASDSSQSDSKRLWAFRSHYDQLLEEMQHLGEVWVERRLKGEDLSVVEDALVKAERESRKYERKIRKLEKRLNASGG